VRLTTAPVRAVTVIVAVGVVVAVSPVPEPIPARTVTVAVSAVVSVVEASPFASVITRVAPSVPLVVANETGTPGIGAPPARIAVATSWTVPPEGGTVLGIASTVTAATAAVPTTIVTELLLVAVSPSAGGVAPIVPDTARTTAVPDVVPVNVVVATPFRVCASGGVTVPRFVVNLTVVPFWTGVPDGSATNAEISVVPPIGSVLVGAVTEIVDALGANNGTLSHAVAVATRAPAMSATIFRLKPEAT
jgi:hypothetical protein